MITTHLTSSYLGGCQMTCFAVWLAHWPAGGVQNQLKLVWPSEFVCLGVDFSGVVDGAFVAGGFTRNPSWCSSTPPPPHKCNYGQHCHNHHHHSHHHCHVASPPASSPWHHLPCQARCPTAFGSQSLLYNFINVMIVKFEWTWTLAIINISMEVWLCVWCAWLNNNNKGMTTLNLFMSNESMGCQCSCIQAWASDEQLGYIKEWWKHQLKIA